MENFATEIVTTICDDYNDDEELVIDMLYYLYHTTTDDTLRKEILQVFNHANYCIECGNKMEYYEWQEPHDELGYTCYETFGVYDCPCCGDNDNKYLKERD